jgi:hypothetical protein
MLKQTDERTAPLLTILRGQFLLVVGVVVVSADEADVRLLRGGTAIKPPECTFPVRPRRLDGCQHKMQMQQQLYLRGAGHVQTNVSDARHS